MSPELIAILTIGVSLGGGQLATVLWAANRFERLGNEITDVRKEITDVRKEIADVR